MRTKRGRRLIFDLFAALARPSARFLPRPLLRTASQASLLRTWCTGVAVAGVLGQLLALFLVFWGGGRKGKNEAKCVA